jgi:hypothetical protein
MWQILRESKLISYLSLFTSFGTLFCCAIPSTFVLLGFGASFAGLLGAYPQIIWFSDYKAWVFGLSFFMLAISYASQKYTASQVCPIDKIEDCQSTKNWTKPMFFFALIINVIGVFYAFVLPRLL